MNKLYKSNNLDNFVNRTERKFFLFLRVSFHLLYIGMMAYAIILLKNTTQPKVYLSAIVGLTMGVCLTVTNIVLQITGNKAFFGNIQSPSPSWISQRLWVIGVFSVIHVIWFWVTSAFALQTSDADTVRTAASAVLTITITWAVFTLVWIIKKIIPGRRWRWALPEKID